MARIRSLHPGQWTDESFVSCSAMARLLSLALRNLADDHGVFEWKPLGLKMQIFPADTVDLPALLSELVSSDQIREFEVDGKRYGAIRNFRKWQRPESPKYRHPLPDELQTYVGLSEIVRQPLDDRSPNGSRKSPQRKEEGGKRKEVESPSSTVELNPSESELDDAARADGAADPPPDPDRYAFEAGPIRLSRRDLDRWRDAYPNLSLEAELLGLSQWAGEPAQKKRWFHAVQGALAKRNREQAAALERARAEAEFKAASPRRSQLWI
ncbi:hypothetical protein [Enterovirga aerilata]|uniref:DnaT DNA-binding domain-containing protein n=1 Tax=Enterovirga aerilata TaxID=2730920 RepID=A0A849IF15_9HYPH|nr:hypothetical protein [Enterovirga sp. DB1703]NNM75039.1 hypothetical protein [Enterovirga sp. DB1703]